MPPKESLEWVFKVGGIGAVIGLVIALALGIVLRHLVLKWLDNKFAERLQALKNEQDRELRALQSQIDRQLDRSRLLHAKEFESIAEAWRLVHEAYWMTRSAVSPLQHYADVGRMDAAELRRFLEGSEIPESEKEDIIVLRDRQARQDAYGRSVDWQQSLKCMQRRQEAVVFVERHSIFMVKELTELFRELDRLIVGALTELQMNLRHPEDRYQDGRRARASAVEARGQEIVEALETMIHARLWEAASPAVSAGHALRPGAQR